MNTNGTFPELRDVSREELYEQVWATPINHLAVKYSVSGSYLARVCTALNVPRPPLGYWQQKAVGKEKPRPELPASLPGDQLIWSKDKALAVPARARVQRAKRDLSTTRNKGPTRHPMLIGVEGHFRKSRTTEEGEFLRPYKRLLPDIICSEACLAQALEIANQIYTELGKSGHRVLLALPNDGLRRIQVNEQEKAQKDRKYGRYSTTPVWAPDRPTVTYIGSIPIGLALIEMTERVTVRYLDGQYVREDSKAARSAKPWQLTQSWTTEQDLPSGRFRFVAYAPVAGVDWSVNWQETETSSLSSLVVAIVRKLKGATSELQGMMTAAKEAALRRQREWEEQQERYRRNEDRRLSEQALIDSKKQLGDIIDKWAGTVAIERFFEEAERRLEGLDGDRLARVRERFTLARSMLGTTDPLQHLEEWLAPTERYKSRYPDG